MSEAIGARSRLRNGRIYLRLDGIEVYRFSDFSDSTDSYGDEDK